MTRPRKRLLLIDAGFRPTEMRAFALDVAGYRVIEAEPGESMLRALKAGTDAIDLVIVTGMEVGVFRSGGVLPESVKRELVRGIKAASRVSVLIVARRPFDSPGGASWLAELGAEDAVIDGDSMAEILEATRNQLARRRLQRKDAVAARMTDAAAEKKELYG